METRLHQRRRIPHVVQPRRTPHGLSVIAQIQLADQVIRGRADTLHVRPARPQLGQDRPRQPHRPRHQVPSNATHMPMMHHSKIDQLTNGGPGAGASGLAPSDPDTAQNQRVQIVFTASRSRCPPPAGELGLERLDLGQLLARGSRLPPSSTSAWITHRSTDSLPTSSCLATADDAAVNDGYSPTWSLTRRTARAFQLRIDPLGHGAHPSNAERCGIKSGALH